MCETIDPVRSSQEAVLAGLDLEGLDYGDLNADHVLLTSTVKGRPSPKIGVMVEEKDGALTVAGVSKKSPAEKAGLEKGDVIGSLPFLDIGHEPRSASVLSSNDLKTRKLDTKGLQKEYEILPNMFRSFIYNICACVSLTTRLVTHLYSKEYKKD